MILPPTMALRQCEWSEENIQAITELAQKHGIKVILCSVLAVNDYTTEPQSPRHPPAQIVKFNKWLREYSEQSGAVYCDYYSAVVDQKSFLKNDCSEDGLHPNAKGYELMVPVAQASIEKAHGNEGIGCSSPKRGALH
jgi:lysophospholipase L1-like esterase